MTREIIEDFRFIVIPYMVNRLEEINYEGQGGSDAKEFMSNFNEILDLAIKALGQEPTTKNDLGVDREDAVERLNAIKQLIGYDKDSEIVKATQKSLDMAIKALEHPEKNVVAVVPCGDCISREQALKELKESAEHHANDSREEALLRRDRDIIRALPSVTPQEPQTFKWCETCKEYDQEKHCCHRYSKVIRDTVEEMKEVYIKREVLDKIRAQIKSNLRGVEITLEVLNENHPLRLKMAGAKDTLEDCLEIINKAESEG